MKSAEKRRRILSITVWMILLLGCVLLGYALSSLVFQTTGKPPEFLSYLISVVLGMLIFGGVGRLVSELILRSKRGQEHARRRHHFLESTIEALNRISHGDFNIAIDIQEHDPFSEVAESVNKMARELSGMEAQRQDFISNVSHEIQSPLTSISGFAALLKSDSLTKEQRAHYIDVIETESKRLSKLSDNLLKLSTLESENAPLSLNDFRLDKQMEHAVLILEPQWMKKNIEIDAQLEKVTLRADEDLLSQVWINLIHNAVKFTPENGKIEVGLYRQDKRIVCFVADNGIGISKSDQIHIFERFFKVDKARDRALGGNGLGLSLCKKIVELHGGEIAVESEPGRGTKFIVTLPG